MRTLNSYLLLPRPGDTIKWWIVPLAFLYGVVVRGDVDRELVARAAAVWFGLEFLIYQARYQWNDIRGFRADQLHPDAASRGRLPGPLDRERRHVAASWGVVAGRLVAAAGLGAWLGWDAVGRPLAVLAIAVFGLAAAYEACKSRATGRSDSVPPPLTLPLLGVWLLIGGGYAIRGLTGLALAVDIWERPVLAGACFVACWSFGISFVMGRWALESLAFARPVAGRLEWSATARHGREHTTGLARWLPERVGAEVSSAASWRPLRLRTRLAAPWNLAFVVAGAAAFVVGRLMVGGAVDAALLLAALAGAVLSVLVAQVGKPRLWVALGCAVVAAVVAERLGAPRAAVMTTPWAAFALAHWWFSCQSLQSLGRPLLERRPGATRSHAARAPS
ncbi:MAG: putative rane protein [Thermoleophilia bacterium]|nr:putative rane protein [Thermoleophilia bacterium]